MRSPKVGIGLNCKNFDVNMPRNDHITSVTCSERVGEVSGPSESLLKMECISLPGVVDVPCYGSSPTVTSQNLDVHPSPYTNPTPRNKIQMDGSSHFLDWASCYQKHRHSTEIIRWPRILRIENAAPSECWKRSRTRSGQTLGRHLRRPPSGATC